MIKEILTFTYLTLFAYYGVSQKSYIDGKIPEIIPMKRFFESRDPKEYELNMSFDPDDFCGDVGNSDNKKSNSDYIENKEFI